MSQHPQSYEPDEPNDSYTDIPVHDTLAARSFVLADEDGHTRAQLALNGFNEPHLTFLDRNGTTALGVGLGEHGRPNVTLYDAGGKLLVGLSIFEEGSSGLIFFDPVGDVPRAMLTMGAEGIVMLGIRDAHNVQRVSIFVGPDGEVTIEATDDKGKRTL